MAPTNFINHNTTHICEAKYASKINLKTLLTFWGGLHKVGDECTVC